MFTSDGGPTRRVGIEVEFSGLTLAQAIGVVAKSLEARAEPVSNHEYLLHAAEQPGPWRLEVDFELLKSLSRSDANRPGSFNEAALEALQYAASVVVPLELITPPLEFRAIPGLDDLLKELAAAGAVGSQDSWVYAFGTHFNPDVPSRDADTLLRHLRAFLCLDDWLRHRDRMDLTRRLTFFADPFPRRYERAVLDPGYAPTLVELMDDYLTYNATRNRALDLLPLFAHLDESRVRSMLDDDRIKARPTFHYRLPSSRVGDPAWSVQKSWKDWLTVERLAADPKRLATLSAERRAHLEPGNILASAKEWVSRCDSLVADLA